MSKRRSPFSAAHYNFEGHKRGGRAKFGHARGSTGGLKQQHAIPGKHGPARVDRVSRRGKEGGGPALTAPGALDQSYRGAGRFLIEHARPSKNVIDLQPHADTFNSRFIGAEPRRKQEGGGA
jgi:hypothetical protein